MRHARKIVNLLALAGVLSVVAWGCSTDSPTAPRQDVPPPDAPGQTYFITVGADPSGIVISDTAPTGTESTTLLIEVRVGSAGGPPAPDDTTILVDTSLGSFDPSSLVQSGGVSLVNGRAFLTLFSGGVPVQLGIATVRATLQASVARLDVPISTLEADFATSNPENNLSVDFTDLSKGNPTSFQWDFGDGRTSSLRNPVHLYSGPGTYQVTLTVSKSVAGVVLSSSKTEPVTVSEEMAP